jgi:hypothetical protein
MLITLLIEGQTINGLGFLKIGISSMALIDTLKSHGFSYKEVVDSRMPVPKQIVKYIEDPYFYQTSRYAPIVKGYTLFKVTDFTVSDFKFNVITLTFCNDSLIEIEIFDAPLEFSNFLLVKYKSIDRETGSKIITCQNAFGAITKHKEDTQLIYYRKDKVYCTLYVGNSYDDNCEESFSNNFRMYDNLKMKQYEKLVKIEIAKREKDKEDELINSQKDY